MHNLELFVLKAVWNWHDLGKSEHVQLCVAHGQDSESRPIIWLLEYGLPRLADVYGQNISVIIVSNVTH